MEIKFNQKKFAAACDKQANDTGLTTLSKKLADDVRRDPVRFARLKRQLSDQLAIVVLTADSVGLDMQELFNDITAVVDEAGLSQQNAPSSSEGLN